jgi:hypothetical protein
MSISSSSGYLPTKQNQNFTTFVGWHSRCLVVSHIASDLDSANAIMDNLLYMTPVRQLLYVTDTVDGKAGRTFEHLSCFLAGLFALGVYSLPNLPPRHAWAAEGLGHTCYMSYADTKTGMGPDQLEILEGSRGERWVDVVSRWEQAGKKGGVPPGVNQARPVSDPESREYIVKDSYNPLRPEVICVFLNSCDGPVLTVSRQSRASTSYGALPRIRSGARVDGKYLNRSKSTAERKMASLVC